MLKPSFCQHCQKEVDQEFADERAKKTQLILCRKCAPIIDKKLKDWYPLWQKFKL